jgi:hypothetical protein
MSWSFVVGLILSVSGIIISTYGVYMVYENVKWRWIYWLGFATLILGIASLVFLHI